MSKILIVYGTAHGQTQKIARAIARELRTLDHEVSLHDSRDINESISPIRYDFVALGGSVQARDFQKPLKKWIHAHAHGLKQVPTAFFSVCLGILQKDEKVQKEEKEIVEHLFEETGWYPSLWTIFAGALPYTKYKWLTKFIMRRISKKAGGDTDTSRDYEYTDWEDVRDFAREIIRTMDKLPHERADASQIGLYTQNKSTEESAQHLL